MLLSELNWATHAFGLWTAADVPGTTIRVVRYDYGSAPGAPRFFINSKYGALVGRQASDYCWSDLDALDAQCILYYLLGNNQSNEKNDDGD
jgi:hypothetical protein